MDLAITPEPVFVLGAPRSGTSMMQWALRQHPALWGGPESDFMIPLIEALREIHAFGSTRERLHWLSGQDVDVAEFLRFMGLGLNALYTDRSQGLRWVEQTPQYTLHIPEILQLLPGSRFVMMVRDGRDVVASLRNFVNPVEHDEACRIWERFVTVGLDSADRYPDRVHVVRYDAAVGDTVASMAGIFEFLDLETSDASAAWITDRGPINSSFADRDKGAPRWSDWSMSDRVRFAEIAGPALIRAGFETDDAWVDA